MCTFVWIGNNNKSNKDSRNGIWWTKLIFVFFVILLENFDIFFAKGDNDATAPRRQGNFCHFFIIFSSSYIERKIDERVTKTTAWSVRVARFFLVQNTKTGKNVPNYHELPIPNVHKI
jgi:hypothetical protein